MKKIPVLLDEYGNFLDTPYERIELDKSEQEEIKKAEDIFKKYNIFIPYKDYYKVEDEKNRLSSINYNLQQSFGVCSFLGVIWSAGALYAYYTNQFVGVEFLLFLIFADFLCLLIKLTKIM